METEQPRNKSQTKTKQPRKKLTKQKKSKKLPG